MKTSKIKPIIVFLLLGFAFISCSSDDDAPKDEQKKDVLTGKWFFESAEGREPLTACEKTAYLEFNDDKTAYVLLVADNPEGACVPLLDTKYKFELLSDSIIKFTVVNAEGEGSVFNSEIISLSETKLVLKDFAFMTGKVQFKK